MTLTYSDPPAVLRTTLTIVFADEDQDYAEVARQTVPWTVGRGVPDTIIDQKGGIWKLDTRLATEPNTFRFILANTLDLQLL